MVACMSITKTIDRRRAPRIDGMAVTAPAPLDDGCGASTGCGAQTCDGCATGRCGSSACACAAQCGGGNVWFTGPEPDDASPMQHWALAVFLVLVMASAVVSFVLLSLGYEALRTALGGLI